MIQDYGLIADFRTAALISDRGSIDWLCLPRFDSASIFGALLDPDDGGTFELGPTGEADAVRSYADGSLALVTEWSDGGSRAKVTDLLLTGTDDEQGVEIDRRRLVRIVEGVRSEIDFRLRIAPRFDYGRLRPWLRKEDGGSWSMIAGDDGLVVSSEVPLEPSAERDCLISQFTLSAGQRLHTVIEYRRPSDIDRDPSVDDQPDRIDAAVETCLADWAEWNKSITYSGPDAEGVAHSARVLKALTYRPTGAMVAAVTTSLPEALGEGRNWDYRYSWIRDSSFASRTLAKVGAEAESDAFVSFLERSAAGRAEDLQILYGVGGERRVVETEISSLAGYLGSSPVRIGNGASDQLQLDAAGELVNLSWRRHLRGESPDDDHWRFLLSLVELAAERWNEPDRGFWEWRGEPENFVHSKILCWSALDRGLALAEQCMRKAPVSRWKKARDEVREAIEEHGVDHERGCFKQSFEHAGLDASLLLIPAVDFVEWDDPVMVATTEAVQKDLCAQDGLIYRYRRDDGLDGDEGTFVACSFWLAECLARQGQSARAEQVFDHAMSTANDLGLFSEQFDPERQVMLGNFPQGLSHLAHIAACLGMAEAARS